MVRVFKNKWFNRWARGEGIADAMLQNAAAEVIAGQVEANLGGSLFKKRLARAGAGKSGGYRTIIGYKQACSNRLIFLYAFPKSAKANITAKEEAALSLAAEAFLAATEEQVAALLVDGAIWEIQSDE